MLRWTLLVLAACLLPITAMAQMGPQEGGRPGGGGGPPGARGDGPGRGQPPRAMKPIKRDAFDKAVTAMFRSADTNRDGIVTLEELRAIIEARRDTLVRARFAKIDSERNQVIDLNEFLAWQRAMGSVALSENQALAGSGGPVPEVLAPELGDDMDDRVLARLIEPLGAVTIVNANTNYDTGASLEEMLAYQRQRFDAVDADKDGAISMEEMRALEGPDRRRGPGGGRPPGGGNPQGLAPDARPPD